MIISFADSDTEYALRGQVAERRTSKLLIIIKVMNMRGIKGTIKPVTPGELLNEEFLIPLGITKYRLAKEIHVPAQRIGDIVAGKRAVTADTDIRLCRFFGLTAGYWLRAQAVYDTAVLGAKMAADIQKIVPWNNVTA
jgi:addiction module HigA family antidote